MNPAAVFQGKALPRTLALGAASWMAFGAQVTLNFLMPTLLVSKGYSLSESLLFTMIMNIGSLLGACAAAFLASRAPRRTAVTVAASWAASRPSAFALFADTTALILILGAIFQFFTMLLNTTLAAWSPEVFPTSIRAQGTSIVNGIGNIAGAIMPFVALFFFDRFSLAGVFMMVAVMYALLIVAARFSPETKGRSLEDVNEEPPLTNDLIHPPTSAPQRSPKGHVMQHLKISATARGLNYLPEYYAQARGLFADHGLEVTQRGPGPVDRGAGRPGERRRGRRPRRAVGAGDVRRTPAGTTRCSGN